MVGGGGGGGSSRWFTRERDSKEMREMYGDVRRRKGLDSSVCSPSRLRAKRQKKTQKVDMNGKKISTHQHARRRDQHEPLERLSLALRRLHQVARAHLVRLLWSVVALPALGGERGGPRAARDRRNSASLAPFDRKRRGKAPRVAGVGLDELEPLGELGRGAAEDAGGRVLAAGHGSDAVASLIFFLFFCFFDLVDRN